MLFINSNIFKYLNFLKFLFGLFLYIEGVSLTTATNFCNNCQCCSSNHLTAGQYSGNTINENEINSNHLSNSPQLTFSIPNAKPIPLIETENGLQKFYKIDYNGIESNLNKKTFFLPIPVAALIVQPNNLGCNCLKGKTPIIEENVPEENGCESRCEKCTNENETSEEGNNNCCDECLQQNILKKSKKEENKGEQHQFIFHQEPDINNNNKIPLEIFKNFVTKNREGVPENNKISNTFHEESLENLRGRLKDISDKMDLLKQLNAEMRSPLQQTQNHRIFPITKPEFYGKEEIENNNNLITSIGQSTEKDKQLGDNNNNIIIPEQQQKQLFFAPSMSENEQAIKRKIMAKTLTNPINNEEINKTINNIGMISNQNNLKEGQNGQKLLFKVLKDIIQQKRDYGDIKLINNENIQKNTNETFLNGLNVNSVHNEEKQVDEQKNSQTQLNNNFISKKETNNQTKPKILFSQSFPINNPEIFQSQNKTTIELLNQQEYKENNNSATYVHFPEKINQEINNLTPPNNSDFRLPYPPPLPLNTQQQLMQMPDIKPNLIQSPPLNNPKEEHSLYVQGGMVQRQQTQQINDKLFESLNSATNVLNDEIQLREKQHLLSQQMQNSPPLPQNFEQNKTLNENFENNTIPSIQQPKFLSIRQIKNGENEIGYFVNDEFNYLNCEMAKINLNIFNFILLNLIVNLFVIFFIHLI